MAEGYAREIFGDKAQVFSAGVLSSFVHPMAIRVMNEEGIDISGQTSKSIEEVKPQMGDPVDYVITLCSHAEQVCPNFPGEKEHRHWPIDDPVQFFGEERNNKFREVRNSIRAKVQAFHDEICKETSK